MTEKEIKITRKIHHGWQEWKDIPARLKKEFKIIKDAGLFGKYQYVYENKKGMISLIQIKHFSYKDFSKDVWLWEIYELSDNDLFSDVKRFDTKKEAVKEIRRCLTQTK